MNLFRRILIASFPQRSGTSRGVATFLTARSTAAEVKEVKLAYREYEKRKVFEKLRCLTVLDRTVAETLNEATTVEEKKRIAVTKADLVRWAKQLAKEGRHQQALEIFEWMDEVRKMPFTGTQLALYVDLILKIKGYEAAEDYFYKVDPNFNIMDTTNAKKNAPAYVKLCRYLHEGVLQSKVTYLNKIVE